MSRVFCLIITLTFRQFLINVFVETMNMMGVGGVWGERESNIKGELSGCLHRKLKRKVVG